MPLVERCNDWATDDQSYDDPHTLAFDHRSEAGIEALQRVKAGDGLAGAEE